MNQEILEQQKFIYGKKWNEYKWNGEKLFPVFMPMEYIFKDTPRFYKAHVDARKGKYNVLGSPRSGTKWCQRVVQQITNKGVTHGHCGMLEDFKPNQYIIFIMRDPRDSIISAYFFIKAGRSHGDMDTIPRILNSVSIDNGIKKVLIMYMKYRMPFASYWGNQTALNLIKVKYEDLIKNRRQCIEQIAYKLRVPLKLERIKKIMINTSFRAMAHRGRDIGQEDKHHHMRKGIIGDWQNYFTEEHNKIFEDMGGIDFLKHFGYI